MHGQQTRMPACLKARVVLALAAVGVLSCTGDRRQQPLSAERDSAGVVIAESTGPAWERTGGWTVAPQPIVDIGVVEGPVEYPLHRATAAVRLSYGRLALVNGGTNELRLYYRRGRGFDLFQVATDFLLGRWLDEFGVEHIRGYELAR